MKMYRIKDLINVTDLDILFTIVSDRVPQLWINTSNVNMKKLSIESIESLEIPKRKGPLSLRLRGKYTLNATPYEIRFNIKL